MTLVSNYQFQELPAGLELVVPFGKYKVHGGIAVGRCCEVYEGVDAVQGKSVALKVFRRHQKYQGALERELFFLRSLGAAGAPIVNHIGEVQWEGRDILVQELLGPTLREVVLGHGHRPCSPWLMVTLTTHILRGLQHLHDRGAVHGDLKPPNILWDAQTATFKLIDFGVSFTTSEELNHAVQSKGYQAPECVVWSRTLGEGGTERVVRPGPPADLWSAGCVVVECLTRCQLFPEGCQYKNVPSILRSALASLRSNFTQEFLQESYAFLMRILQVHPEERARVQGLLGDPWLHLLPRPSFHDLLHLPTPILRLMGVLNPTPQPTAAYDVEKALVRLCTKYGPICSHHLEGLLGHFYVRYKSSCHSEVAQDHLNGMSFGDRTLVVTFFPPDSWHRREFY